MNSHDPHDHDDLTDRDTPDEVPVPHFENELWRTLAQAHAEQAQSGGAHVPLLAPGVRTHRRGRRMILVGAGSVAAAAIALAAIVATDSGSGSGNGGGPDTEAADTTTPPVSLAAQITAAQEEASETSILHTTRDNQYLAGDDTPVGDEESWTDEQSGAQRNLLYSSDGEPFFDSGRVTAPAVDDQGPPPIPPDAEPTDPSLPTESIRTVDYCFSEYTEADQTAFPGEITADRIGEQLEDGSLIEDGTVEFRGRELIRLVQVPVDYRPDAGGEGGVAMDPETGVTVPVDENGNPLPTTTTAPPVTAPGTGELDPAAFPYVEHIYLVDAETFRPVHVIGYPEEAADYSDAMYITTIDYLPRTPENLASFVAPVPDDFTQVPHLRGDGERYDQCGV
jgi:hypothetical protein